MDNNKNTGAEDDTAAAFIPTSRTLPFAGEQITLKPLNVLQVIQISTVLKQVLPALDNVQALLARFDSDEEAGAEEIALVVSLLADYGMPLTEGVAIAIGKPVAFVQEADDFAGLVTLIAAIVRINFQFFLQQVGPRLAGLQLAANGDGPMPLAPLSPPATH